MYKKTKVAKNVFLIYSLIKTCKMNGLRPIKYIADVLRKLIGGETGYASLLPVKIKNKLKFNQNMGYDTFRGMIAI